VLLAVVVAGTVAGLIGINAARRAYLAEAGLQLGPQEQILEHAFLAINLFVFLAAIVLSYLAHEEDEELDLLHRRVSKLDRKLDAVDAEIHKLTGEAERLKGEQRAELEEVKSIIWELVRMYRGENILARKDHRKPKAFETEPVLAEPRVETESSSLTPETEVDEIRQKRLRVKDGVVAGAAATGAQTRPFA
jgi:uncharacterized protein YdcH (DUF465 family)